MIVRTPDERLTFLQAIGSRRKDAIAGALQAAGAEFRDGPAAADDVGAALLDASQPCQEVLAAGVAVGDERARERAAQLP